VNYICVPCTKHCNFEYYFVRVCGNTCIDLVHPSANGCLLCVVFVLVFFFFPIKNINEIFTFVSEKT
jgi:hypothetical protein